MLGLQSHVRMSKTEIWVYYNSVASISLSFSFTICKMEDITPPSVKGPLDWTISKISRHWTWHVICTQHTMAPSILTRCHTKQVLISQWRRVSAQHPSLTVPTFHAPSHLVFLKANELNVLSCLFYPLMTSSVWEIEWDCLPNFHTVKKISRKS